jgi:putative membrane protein
MKKVLIVLIILTQALLYHACNNQDKNKAEKSTILVNQSDVDEEAKSFMKAASISGIMEVELAKLAQKQASSSAVKEYADMMIADHTRIYNDLKKLATDKHILLPIDLEPKEREQLERLQKLNGAEFDENYMRFMVTSHEKAVSDFEMGGRNRDRDVNKFASAKIEELKTHLNSARSLFNTVVIKGQ